MLANSKDSTTSSKNLRMVMKNHNLLGTLERVAPALSGASVLDAMPLVDRRAAACNQRLQPRTKGV